MKYGLMAILLVSGMTTVRAQGPYTEIGINGFIRHDGTHAAPGDADAIPNPIIRAWATGYLDYAPADNSWSGPWNIPEKALGPATGDLADIVSLGELAADEIDAGKQPGRITFTFGDPNDPHSATGIIHNGGGWDFAIFENGFIADLDTSAGTIAGKMFLELGFVEVSSDNLTFARFPTVSLTEKPTGNYAYLTMDVTNIYNFAGKHPNAGGFCIGTPFDLSDLSDHPAVQDGRVDLNAIRYIRIMDVPGSGNYSDLAQEFIDPDSSPDWVSYDVNHAVYDTWPTWGSGGIDIEAVGLLRSQELPADINLDGIVDLADLTLYVHAWQSRFGDENWNPRCDSTATHDYQVNLHDYSLLNATWLCQEKWYYRTE